jgi:hypothetical protein
LKLFEVLIRLHLRLAILVHRIQAKKINNAQPQKRRNTEAGRRTPLD